MPYASSADMIRIYGEAEMTRLSAPDNALDGPPVTAAIEQALLDASDMIDGYLRPRYAVPLVAPVPPAIARACRVLARHDLASGGQKTPSEQMVRERTDAITWLRDIAAGKVDLDVAAAAPATTVGSGATISDRAPTFTSGGGIGW